MGDRGRPELNAFRTVYGDIVKTGFEVANFGTFHFSADCLQKCVTFCMELSLNIPRFVFLPALDLVSAGLKAAHNGWKHIKNFINARTLC